MQLRILSFVSLLAAGCLVTLCFRAAIGTPLYSARAGRTCDNCHVTPNTWVNPELAERKCGLSCQTCHVDPTGGGMRNVSGRFYGRSTLPVIATSPRPTRDWDRGFLGIVPRLDRATTYTHNIPNGPAGFEASAAYEDSISDWSAFGRPLRGSTRHAPYQGRYGALRADPLFRFGWDVRVAALFSGNLLLFPMQGDFPMSLHPVHHVTLLINTGLRGRVSGFGNPFDEDRRPYFREAFVMAHEMPYQAYVKAGRFTPAYGLRLDDHTSQIRRQFELDGSLPETRVTGVEIGAAPNYPFLNLSWFKMASRGRVPSRFDIFDVDDGWGTAVNAGYRDEGWSLGGSVMLRRRPLAEGGDTSTYGIYGVFNPWYYRPTLPVTYQFEVDFGSYKRASGLGAKQMVVYHELAWVVGNGVNVLATYDWADPDRDVGDDDVHRIGFGAQVIPVPGVTVDGRLRTLVPAASGTDYDLFLQLHFWN